MSSARIKEGGTPRNFSQVFKLKTNLQGGGSCLWVPEDERKLAEKSISENGTYTAEDEGLYGYSKVKVNVPNSGSVSGTDANGNPISVSVDPETGDLVEKELPYSIDITTPPLKIMYTDGETIDPTGMVVTAYKKDGTVWEDTGYTGGVIPLTEITLDPNTADIGQVSDDETATSSLIGGREIPITNTLELRQEPSSDYMWVDLSGAVFTKYTDSFSHSDGYIAASETDGSFTRRTRRWYNGEYDETNSMSFDHSFTYGGKTVYWTANSYLWKRFTSNADSGEIQSGMLAEVAWTMIYGDIEGGDQTISVKWDRPEDYKTLEDGFEVGVQGEANENNGGFEGGGSSHGF